MKDTRLKYNPFMLIVDQTVVCNEACFFCWRADRDLVKEQTKKAHGQIHLPAEMNREIIDQASRVYTIRTYNVCGPMGDPTLVPDIVERGLYAKEKGFSDRMMNTNGVALDKHDPAQMLTAFNNLKVSLDTLDPEKYIDIHGRDHLERVLKNIENYWKVKVDKNISGDFKAKITLNPKNEDEKEAFEIWSKKTGVPLQWKRIHSFVDTLPEYGNDWGVKLCEQPYKTVNFNFRGELTTCCINYKLNPTFGTLEDGSLKEIWEGEKYENWRKTRLEDICRGCSGLGGRLNKPELVKEYEMMGEENFNMRR